MDSLSGYSTRHRVFKATHANGDGAASEWLHVATALRIRVALRSRRRAFSQEEAWVKSSS
jgi:hypothetical protein